MRTRDAMTPDEKKWIKRLKRTLDDMPLGLWLFVSGEVNVMRVDEDGGHAVDGRGCVDPDYLIDVIQANCDGGGW